MSYTSFTVNVTNNFTFKKGWSAELSGFYRHKAIAGLTQMEPIYQMSIGLQKQVMKGKGTLRFNFRDPFAWQKFEGRNTLWNDRWRICFHDPIQDRLTGTFTWRFGKT